MNILFELTSVSCHVTVDFERVSLSLRVDPVLPVLVGFDGVPDVLTGKARIIRARSFRYCSNKHENV